MKLFFDKEYELDTQKKINYYEYLYNERTVLTDPLFQPREDALTKNSVVIGEYTERYTQKINGTYSSYRSLRKYVEFEDVPLLTEEQDTALNEFVPELSIQEIDGKKEVVISNLSEFEKKNKISIDSLAVFAVRKVGRDSVSFRRGWSYQKDKIRNFNGIDERKSHMQGDKTRYRIRYDEIDSSFFKNQEIPEDTSYAVLYNYYLQFKSPNVNNTSERRNKNNYKFPFKILKRNINDKDVYIIPDFINSILNMNINHNIIDSRLLMTDENNNYIYPDGSEFIHNISILIGKISLDRSSSKIISIYKNQKDIIENDTFIDANTKKDSSYLSANSIDIILVRNGDEYKLSDVRVVSNKTE